MNGRFIAPLALMLATAGFAGCLEAMSFLSTSEGEVSAAANRDLADNAAAAWNPDAQLMAVFALETANVTDEFPADPAIGNGLAPLWLYGYVAGNETRAFQVSADGQVRAMEQSLDAPDVGETLSSWQIDSDAAVSAARSNATFDAIAAQPGAVLMEALGAEDGMTVWAIMAGADAGQAIAVVNAVDGALIMVESFEMDFDLPPMPMWGVHGAQPGPQVEMSGEGTVDGETRTSEHPFHVGHADSGLIEIAYEKMLPTDAIAWSIVDAEGERVAGETLRTPEMSGEAASGFEIEQPGEYVLVIEYTSMFVPLGSVDFVFDFFVGPVPEVEDEDARAP